jgi:MoaA/NifB/PqqE/SkfB family radical SAM enzyme
VEIARQLQSMRYRIVSLLTNGLNLDGRQELLDCVDMFLVSLDSLDTERAARMLGRKGALEKIVENVTAAAKLQEEKRFKIYVVICVTRENIPDAHGVIDFALERNIGVTISPEVRGWVPAEGLKGNAQYEAFVDRIIALKRSGADVLGSIPFFQGVRAFDQFDCDPTLLCRVKPNGDLIYPCNRQGAEGINLLTLGSYEKALAVAEEKCGRIGKCPHSCHEGCYLDFSAMVQQPWRLFQEAWIQGVLRPLRRGRGP